MHTADADLEVRVPVKAGLHEVGVSFVRRFWEPEGIAAAAANRLRTHDERVLPRQSRGGDRVDRRAVRRDRHLAIRPAAASCSCAVRNGRRRAESSRVRGRILSTLATRAYRRPVTERTCRRCSTSTRRARRGQLRRRHPARSRAHPGGAELSLPRRTRARGSAPGAVYRLSDLDLASRLSFFLWGSIPDDELREAAIRGNAERSRPCSSSRCSACCAIRARTRSSKISPAAGSS